MLNSYLKKSKKKPSKNHVNIEEYKSIINKVLFLDIFKVELYKAMNNKYKKIVHVFFCLLSFFILLNLNTNASFKDEVHDILDYGREDGLRGEIWYGNASWYGPYWHGRKTSNGEKFDRNKLTAAHRTLPFNTRVKVTNLKNNKSVIVRVNDRGPFKAGRIIDLSEKAADTIDGKKQGISYVKVQVLTSN